MDSLIKHLIYSKTVQNNANQLMLTMTASLGYLTIGLIRGWSSTAMPSIKLYSPHLVPSDYVGSWVSAIPPLGAFMGSLLTGPFLQKFGRKKTMLIAAPIFAVSWVLIGTAVNTAMLIVGRLLTGMCAGIITPAAQVYVSECAHPEIRGVLGSLPALFMATGVLISYIIGTWLPWDHLALVSAIFPTAMLVFLIPLPESPCWLRSRGRKEEAERSANWLRHQKVVNVELYTIRNPETNGAETPTAIAEVDRKQEMTTGSAKSIAKGAYSAEALLRRPVIIPFGLVTGVLIFQQVSGIDTVLFYTVEIFNASGSFVNDYLATILVGLVQVLATLASLFVIDSYGRKPLLIFSGAFMSVAMAALGYYFYAHEHGLPIAKSLGLLPVISLMVFIAAFALGYCNVPFLLMGELLPVAQRSILSSVASAMNLGSMFLIIKSYHDLKYWIGDHGVFFSYAVLCIVSCVFVTILLPETKGKSLEEIECYFEDKSQKLKEKKVQRKSETSNEQ
ncbi:facilitated trehalose transporter Tret1-2 homolog isoform X2 [Macrosteles quadrilineatus]|uniref:facilitated trehalose transporter Tret1-2 homolog isoform X2 n=1 Tax=Macrosteles quadrilineatus TaxID=74068 RepID=UPI0023E1FDE1|nr:facilitated trehalose transporter Tret1-2 homolog isoform X2 [Macrosteles quadrilineatus]